MIALPPRFALALAALAVALTGCSHSGSNGQNPTPDGVLAVERAIPPLENARTAVGGVLDGLLSAAEAVDARDEVGARGDRSGMRALVSAHPFSVAQLDAAAVAAPHGAQSYTEAVRVLTGAAATARLPGPQQAALTRVVGAVRAEAAADTELARIASYFWPRYRRLANLQAKWLERARGGWYRNTKESADAYAVLTSQARPPVQTARAQLEVAATARQRATEAYAAAVTAFRQVPSTPTG
ncbi:MAG: hypothetical protein QOJ92_2862 [Frankiales bacterium]|nr:hypothetical protein [Frankiales bacterium]